ncbi:MAG: DUF885 domain-containing protein [Gammaproteobacteria bacterium]|nr:DUF885 domain-containing protein [Gammaproteobacteria bacterium]
MRKHLLLLVTLLVASTAQAQDSSIDQLFADYSSYQESRYPSVDHANEAMRKGGFADISPAAYAQQAEKLQQFLQQVEQFEQQKLTSQQQVNLAMLRFFIESEIKAIEQQSYLFPMYGDTGFYFELLRLGETTELKSRADVIFYLEKLEAIAGYLAQWQANLATAVAEKKVLPKIVLVDFERPLQALLAKHPEQNPLYAPLRKVGQLLDEETSQLLQQRGRQAIAEGVEPAVKSFIQFLQSDYLPHARESIAITDMPGGAAYYQEQIRYYTTLELSADAIHQVGLAEVARIRGEMDAVIAASGFKGSFSEFIEFLRTDPQFYATSKEALLKEAAYIAKKADAMLPRFFGHLPRQPYGVEPVPDSIAPRYTTGRYVGAPLDSERPGLYWVNTYALDKRPLYVLEALTLHEAVPGHHLQNALTQEQDSLPDFRRHSYLSAYGEGWALYGEKLGIEAGFYQDHYSQFGRLSYEMWRAIRLVVDTGMHAKGWSRAKAIAFMESNTALSKHNVRTEIDRYIAWPGQALSYKMGEIKIVELRRLAEAQLGKRFDIRQFHDELLSYGPVTLTILEQQMKQWIERQLASAPAP